MDPQQLLLAFYGDDFTGSTDAMEGLAVNGYRTVLFLEAPSEELLKSFAGIRCIGVAGTSRAKTPADMEKELRPVFEKLAQLPVQLIHYKVCSTFDSSEAVGSIGKAIEVARTYFSNNAVIPLLVGAPALGRYTVFGQHFARMHDEVYRLDQHPVMSRHPITPMREADLRVHLSKQTNERIELLSILDLEGEEKEVRERFEAKISEQPGVLLFDVLDDSRLQRAGQLIWEAAQGTSRFVVGSSGVEYALTAHWQLIGNAPVKTEVELQPVQKVDQILVVSGSASPITKQQIENALAHGFYGIRIPVEAIVDTDPLPVSLLQKAIEQLKQGKSVVMYTAMGPDDISIAQTRDALAAKNIRDTDSGEIIGRKLGRWMREIMKMVPLRRVVVAGGDTSGFVTKEMNIYGLEMLKPVSPGAPLCKAYSFEEKLNGVEIALKGGQLGSPDFFVKVLNIEDNAKESACPN